MPPSRQIWRVRGVPNEFGKEELADVLQHHPDLQHQSGEALEDTDDRRSGDNGIWVRTLAPDLRRDQVATIHFRYLPARLSTLERSNQLTIDVHTTPPTRLVIDQHFSGITILFSPSSGDYEVDVLAVSGLGSHSFGSFVHKGDGHMWLSDSLPQDIPAARIMIYGYESGLQDSTSFSLLDDLASSLYFDICRLLKSGERKRLILIGHSLGGLLIKGALIRMSKSHLEVNLMKQVFGGVFFGVPNHGIDIESLIAMVNDQPNRALIESLSSINSQSLRRQDQKFAKFLNHSVFEMFCFYETRISPTAAKDPKTGEYKMNGPPRCLVTATSATGCLPSDGLSDQSAAVDRTHSELVKFASFDAEYDKVSYVLSRMYGNCVRASNTFEDGAAPLETVHKYTLRTKPWKDIEQEPRKEYTKASAPSTFALGESGFTGQSTTRLEDAGENAPKTIRKKAALQPASALRTRKPSPMSVPTEPADVIKPCAPFKPLSDSNLAGSNINEPSKSISYPPPAKDDSNLKDKYPDAGNPNREAVPGSSEPLITPLSDNRKRNKSFQPKRKTPRPEAWGHNQVQEPDDPARSVSSNHSTQSKQRVKPKSPKPDNWNSKLIPSSTYTDAYGNSHPPRTGLAEPVASKEPDVIVAICFTTELFHVAFVAPPRPDGNDHSLSKYIDVHTHDIPVDTWIFNRGMDRQVEGWPNPVVSFSHFMADAYETIQGCIRSTFPDLFKWSQGADLSIKFEFLWSPNLESKVYHAIGPLHTAIQQSYFGLDQQLDIHKSEINPIIHASIVANAVRTYPGQIILSVCSRGDNIKISAMLAQVEGFEALLARTFYEGNWMSLVLEPLRSSIKRRVIRGYDNAGNEALVDKAWEDGEFRILLYGVRGDESDPEDILVRLPAYWGSEVDGIIDDEVYIPRSEVSSWFDAFISSVCQRVHSFLDDLYHKRGRRDVTCIVLDGSPFNYSFIKKGLASSLASSLARSMDVRQISLLQPQVPGFAIPQGMLCRLNIDCPVLPKHWQATADRMPVSYGLVVRQKTGRKSLINENLTSPNDVAQPLNSIAWLVDKGDNIASFGSKSLPLEFDVYAKTDTLDLIFGVIVSASQPPFLPDLLEEDPARQSSTFKVCDVIIKLRQKNLTELLPITSKNSLGIKSVKSYHGKLELKFSASFHKFQFKVLVGDKKSLLDASRVTLKWDEDGKRRWQTCLKYVENGSPL